MSTKSNSTNESKRGALDPLMTAMDLAEYLSVPRDRVYDCYRKWDVPFTRLGSELRWRLEDVDAWLDVGREIPRRWQQ